MSTPFAAIGWSANPNAYMAGQLAARSAWQQLAPQRPVCGIVFGSSWFDQTHLLNGVKHVFQQVPVVGGSTAGEITPQGPKSHSCVVLALSSEQVAVSLGVGTGVRADPRLAGHQAAQQAVRHFPGKTRRGLILFGDGLSTGYAEVLRGVQEVLGTSSLVTGGLMADDLRFAHTYQYADREVLKEAVVGLMLGDGCTIGVGVEHGFAPISKPRRVTRARGPLLQELDGHPASSVYEEYFGAGLLERVQQAGLTRGLIAYPLGIQMDAGNDYLLRNIMAFETDGSLMCTGEVTEGAWVQLMIGSKELALQAASSAARQAVQHLSNVWCLIVFDSVARRKLLGREAALELTRIREVVGLHVPIVGCYTYGEQAPLGTPYPYGRSSVQTGACLIVALGS